MLTRSRVEQRVVNRRLATGVRCDGSSPSCARISRPRQPWPPSAIAFRRGVRDRSSCSASARRASSRRAAPGRSGSRRLRSVPRARRRHRGAGRHHRRALARRLRRDAARPSGHRHARRFVECPGTYDDHANLALGRMIRAAGLAAHRARRRLGPLGRGRAGARGRLRCGSSDGAEFAVHAWEDEDGYEAADYAANSPENRKYLAYYREMGMSAARPRRSTR